VIAPGLEVFSSLLIMVDVFDFLQFKTYWFQVII